MAERSNSGSPAKQEVTKFDDYSTYLMWKNNHINNERKLLAWIRTSIGLLTLGFIIERIEFFLQSTGQNTRFMDSLPELPPYFHLVAIAFFALGGIIIGIATWEFFLDRKRINRITKESNFRLDVLITVTLILLILVAVIFLFQL